MQWQCDPITSIQEIQYLSRVHLLGGSTRTSCIDVLCLCDGSIKCEHYAIDSVPWGILMLNLEWYENWITSDEQLIIAALYDNFMTSSYKKAALFVFTYADFLLTTKI